MAMKPLYALLPLVLFGCRNSDGEIAYFGSKTTTTVQGEKVEATDAHRKELRLVEAAGWDLVRMAGVGKGTRNSVVSPLSYAQALALMANAADGDTRAALTQMLHLPVGGLTEYNDANAALATSAEADGSLTLANAVWCIWPMPIRKEYGELVRDKYWAKSVNLGSAGLESLNQINTWCKKQTKGRIPKLLDHLSKSTSVVFTNAITYEAAWAKPFPAATPAPFRAPGGTVQLPTLSDERRYARAAHDGVTMAMPESGYVSVAYVLPREGQALDSLLEELSKGLLAKLINESAMARGRIQVPKLKLEATNDLTAAFRKELASRGVASLDLRFLSHELTGQEVSQVIQRVTLEADEVGARGASSSAFALDSAVSDTTDFVADRPFVVLVTYRGDGFLVPVVIAAIHDPRQGA